MEVKAAEGPTVCSTRKTSSSSLGGTDETAHPLHHGRFGPDHGGRPPGRHVGAGQQPPHPPEPTPAGRVRPLAPPRPHPARRTRPQGPDPVRHHPRPPQRGLPRLPHPSGTDSFGTSLELIHATPAARLRDELATHFRRRTPPPWVRRLADGDPCARGELRLALTTYFHELLAPQLPLIGETFHLERAQHSRDVLEGGVEQLLHTLPPSIRWTSPTLTADYPRDRDLHLDGRGITLVPSFFCTKSPVTLINPGLPPVLVYPVARRRPLPATPPEGLTDLLGRTRALILQALTPPCSTGELARRTGVSIGTASKHASVLRKAGLITSTRRGCMMLHALPPLGSELARRRAG